MYSVILIFVLALTSFSLSLTTNSTFVLEHCLNYLAKYNDMKVESIISICDYDYGCEENFVFEDDILKVPFIKNKTITYTSLVYGKNTTDRVLKLLSQFTPTIIVLYDFTTSKNIKELFNNIPTYSFVQNTWMVILPQHIKETQMRHVIVDNFNDIKKSALEINSQIYALYCIKSNLKLFN